MDGNKQERSNEGPIFNFDKELYRKFLNKKSCPKSRNLRSLRPSKRNSESHLQRKLLAENPNER